MEAKHRHVDVTDRLKEMARHDRTFRLDFRTFGVDPDEGHQKALRIYARGPNGQERMFEYLDGSVIDGAMFRGWGRGEWGNGGWSGNWNGRPRRRGRVPDSERAVWERASPCGCHEPAEGTSAHDLTVPVGLPYVRRRPGSRDTRRCCGFMRVVRTGASACSSIAMAA